MSTEADTLSDKPWPIPSLWQWAKMAEISTVIAGGTPATLESANFDGGTIPWITPADLSGFSEKTILRGARSITQRGLDNSGAQLIPMGSVLFSSRAPIGYVAVAGNQLTTNQGFKSFALGQAVTSDYVYYYLQRAKEIALKMASGTTFLELSKKRAESLPIPVPPLPEQRRIVEAIEANFVRLDAGVKALERVRMNLTRYRASVLASAFGAPHPSDWVTSTIGDVTVPTVSQDGPHGVSSFAYVDISSIDNRIKRISEPKWIPVEERPSRARQRLNPGDVVVSMTRPNLNAVAMVPDGLSGAIGSTGFDVLRTRCIDARWLFLFVQTPAFIHAMTARVQGALYPAVRPRDIRSYPIPVAPLDQQHRIVAGIESRLSLANEVAVSTEHGLKRCLGIRNFVLKQAFEGHLVPQDPTDEPANVLLERIKKERSSASQSMTRREENPKGIMR